MTKVYFSLTVWRTLKFNLLHFKQNQFHLKHDMISTTKDTLNTRHILLKSYALNNTSILCESCILVKLFDAKQNLMLYVLTKSRFTWNIEYLVSE